MMHSIHFFHQWPHWLNQEKQDCSCFIGWDDYFMDIVHTGSGKPWYTHQTENQWTTMTHLESPNTQCKRVLNNRNPAWDWKKKNKVSFSPCRASGLAAASPTGTCFPWQCCAAPPQLQTEGCPLHTHDLRDSQPANRQKTITVHPYPLRTWKRPHTHLKKTLMCVLA